MFGLGMAKVSGRTAAVLVRYDDVFDLSRLKQPAVSAALSGGTDTLNLLQEWPAALAVLKDLADSPELARCQLSEKDISWLPPVCNPSKILCAGANYPDHIREMGGEPHDAGLTQPFLFLKCPSNTLIGNGDNIILPMVSQAVDWEVELAAVIGRRGKHIPERSALEHVAGYTILNDISARDFQRRSDTKFVYDWLGGKSFDTFAPMGPTIVPAEFLPPWEDLHLRLLLNGVVQQDTLAGSMIHSIPQIIAFVSRIVTLEPGDVIATGTPSGVGAARKEFLRPGDEVIAEIEMIGRLKNTCVSEDEIPEVRDR